MTDYNKQAINFLNQTETTFKATFLKYDFHFESDKERRDIYEIELKRGNRVYKFNFGQSINNSMEWIPNTIYAKNRHAKMNYPRIMGNRSEALRVSGVGYSGIDRDLIKNKNFSPPTEYDVLACLTKYNPETLEDFCSEFGYSTDSKKAEKTYLAVRDEYQNVAMLWNDSEIELLHEIQ